MIEFWELGWWGGVKKCQNLTFKVNFLRQKSSESFSIFFIEEYQFRSAFFVIDIFWHIFFLLLEWCPIFDSMSLIQNSKFNDFLLVCWFLCKNLSNFVPPAWKLHNPYCHNIQVWAWLSWQPTQASSLFYSVESRSIISFADIVLLQLVLKEKKPLLSSLEDGLHK